MSCIVCLYIFRYMKTILQDFLSNVSCSLKYQLFGRKELYSSVEPLHYESKKLTLHFLPFVFDFHEISH